MLARGLIERVMAGEDPKTVVEGRRVRVPNFRTSKDAEDWVARLGPDDSPVDDVVDPETGEILMEPGETKRKKAKRRGPGFKKRKPPRYADTDSPMLSSPRGDHWRDERNFNKFYNVVMKPMADEVEDPEHMMAMDYDVSYDFPAVIARKDRKPLNDDDVDNIQFFIDYRQNIGPFNIKLQPIGLKRGGRIVKTLLTFV